MSASKAVSRSLSAPESVSASRDQKIGSTADVAPPAGEGGDHKKRTALNWVLALLTVPGSLVIVAASYIHILGTAGCSNSTCGRLGPGPVTFGVITYGAPLIAIATVGLSLITARRRYGMVLPVITWLLLAAGLLFLDLSFQTPHYG